MCESIATMHELPQSWTEIGLQRPTGANSPKVSARSVTKTFGRGSTAVSALRAVDVEIGGGEFTAIMGPSGSGKSTLMHCLAGLERVTSGTIFLEDTEVTRMSQAKLTKLRRDRIGFIFQSFNLVPTLTAAENITLPADIAHRKLDKERFDRVVQAVDLGDRLTHRPAELSGGQQQRVAVARALVGAPSVIFADEPTGNLDSHSTRQVLTHLREAVDRFGQTVVMVTHEPAAAALADRILFLVDGQVVAQLDKPDQSRVLAALGVLSNAEETEAVAASLAEEGALAPSAEAEEMLAKAQAEAPAAAPAEVPESAAPEAVPAEVSESAALAAAPAAEAEEPLILSGTAAQVPAAKSTTSAPVEPAATPTPVEPPLAVPAFAPGGTPAAEPLVVEAPPLDVSTETQADGIRMIDLTDEPDAERPARRRRPRRQFRDVPVDSPAIGEAEEN